MKFVLFITLVIAAWQTEWIWIIGSAVGLGITLIPNMFHKDVNISLPWSLEFLIASVIGLNMIGVLFDAYYTIPWFGEITQLFTSIFVAFLSFAIIYILDKLWDGLKMNKYAMAFVVVVTTMAAGVVFEFIKYFNIFGKPSFTVEAVLVSLLETMIGGTIIALIGVSWIKRGKFDAITNEMGKDMDEKIIHRNQNRK